MQKVYIAIGFKPKTSKEILPKHSFTERLELMSQCLSFMQSINRNKCQLLDKEYISTEHGGLYPPTIKCLSETVRAIKEVSEILEDN